MKFRSFVAHAILLIVLARPILSGDVYVDFDASGFGLGTQSSPFNNLIWAGVVNYAGSIVYMRGTGKNDACHNTAIENMTFKRWGEAALFFDCFPGTSWTFSHGGGRLEGIKGKGMTIICHEGLFEMKDCEFSQFPTGFGNLNMTGVIPQNLSIVARNSIFRDSSALSGAIGCDLCANVIVADCTFTNIRAPGGSISVTVTNSLIVSNSTFTGGVGVALGGAISFAVLGNGTSNIIDCTFTNCSAVDGGAVSFFLPHQDRSLCACLTRQIHWRPKSATGTPELNIADCLFRNCFATHYGGAIYTFYDTQLTGSTFEDCSTPSPAVGTGGAVYVGGATTTVTGSLFWSCVAHMGGAIATDFTALATVKPALIAAKSEFRQNLAGNLGGAVYLLSGAEIANSISECTFVNNNATSDGGAVYAKTVQLDIDNTEIDRCVAARGGGLALIDDSLTLRDSNITRSFAINNNGDAIYGTFAGTIDSLRLCGNGAPLNNENDISGAIEASPVNVTWCESPSELDNQICTSIPPFGPGATCINGEWTYPSSVTAPPGVTIDEGGVHVLVNLTLMFGVRVYYDQNLSTPITVGGCAFLGGPIEIYLPRLPDSSEGFSLPLLSAACVEGKFAQVSVHLPAGECVQVTGVSQSVNSDGKLSLLLSATDDECPGSSGDSGGGGSRNLKIVVPCAVVGGVLLVGLGVGVFLFHSRHHRRTKARIRGVKSSPQIL